MSLSSNKDYSVPKLVRGNYPTWIILIEDVIMALDHDDAPDIWSVYVWRPDPDHDPDADDGHGNAIGPEVDPIDHDYQDVTGRDGASKKKLRHQHNKVWKFIRALLSPELLLETNDIKPISVPKLLRKIRSYWNDGSTHDLDTLRTEFEDMRLEHYSDMRAYQTAFRIKMAECRSFQIGIAMTDQDALYLFNKHLPAAWKPLITASAAAGHNLNQSLKFYVNQAKVDPLLPGTLKRAAGAAPDQVHATINQQSNTPASDDTREVCRDHAAGRCHRRRCAYRHPSRPGGSNTDDRPKCDHCGKPGHLAIKCYRRIREEKEKKQKQDSTNVTTGCSKCDCKQSDDDYDDGAEFAIGDATFMISEVAPAVAALKPKGYPLAPSLTMPSEVALAVAALKPKGYSPGSPPKGIVMVLDGASTCVIVQTEKGCYNVRKTNRKVRVGGKDGKNILQATKEARFRFSHLVDGVLTVTDLPALVVPGFGCNILPECLFLKRGFSINKTGTEARVITPDGKNYLRADALKVDKSWLFHTTAVPLGAPSPKAPADKTAGKLALVADSEAPSLDFRETQVAVPAVTHVLKMKEGELESHKNTVLLKR